MPRGILGALAICTFLYILVAGIMVGLVDYRELADQAAPIGVAISAALAKAEGTTMGTILKVFPTIINLGAVLGLSSTMVVMVMGQPRVFYSMSKDGLFPMGGEDSPEIPDAAYHNRDHRNDRRRSRGICSDRLLGELVYWDTLRFVIVERESFLVLQSALHRPFRVPLSPFIPIATVVSAAYLMNSCRSTMDSADRLDGYRLFCLLCL